MFIVSKTLDQNSNVSFLRNEFSKIYRHEFGINVGIKKWNSFLG